MSNSKFQPGERLSVSYNQFNRFDEEHTEEFEQSTGNETKLTRCASCCLLVLPLLFCFVIFICTAVALGLHQSHNHQRLTHATNSLHYLNVLLSEKPVKALAFRSSGTSCLYGWEGVDIGQWLGTRSGCLCPNDNTVHSQAYCAVTSTCKYLDAQSVRTLSVWESNRLCIQRFAFFLFLLKF